MSSTAILEEISALSQEEQSELITEATKSIGEEAVSEVWAILETRRRRSEFLSGAPTLTHEQVFSKARASLNDN